MTQAAVIAPGSTIAALLRHSPLDALETRILLTHALGIARVALITQAERQLTPDEAERLSCLLQRRLDGEPIAYITGVREFYGLALQVTPDVLIPRPETELLVDLAIERLPQHGSVLDLGTGSGAIAVAIAHQRPDAKLTAVDASAKALAVAQKNMARHGVQVQCLQSDWYAALDKARFNLIVSNPPYIRKDDVHLTQGDLRFEPIGALSDQSDGLSALRTIIGKAGEHLTAGAWLLVEHGYDQAEAVRGLLAAQGFDLVQSWPDLAGIERVSGGVAVTG